MALEFIPFGLLRLFPDVSSQHPGPIAFRSASKLGGGEWRNDLFGNATVLFGMGSYLQGADGAQVQVRAALQAEGGEKFFIDYISRGDMKTHSAGRTPIYLAGQLDVDPGNEKYAWLNKTQIVGKGMLTFDPLVQTYEMYVLK